MLRIWHTFSEPNNSLSSAACDSALLNRYAVTEGHPDGHLKHPYCTCRLCRCVLIVVGRFATPSPFPLRTKRARSATTAPQDAQLASSGSHQDLSHVEAKRPEGFSPVASFPSLDPQGVPSAAEMTIPKAQRDLFATVPNSQSTWTFATGTAAAAAEGTRGPKKVVTFGELVAEGLRQQHQQPRSGAATSSGELTNSTIVVFHGGHLLQC